MALFPRSQAEIFPFPELLVCLKGSAYKNTEDEQEGTLVITGFAQQAEWVGVLVDDGLGREPVELFEPTSELPSCGETTNRCLKPVSSGSLFQREGRRENHDSTLLRD